MAFKQRRCSIVTEARINERIRAREVRTIDADGKQAGILPLSKALKLAEERGLDLVEVAPQVVPPVCRIMDYGKYRYEQTKREKESQKHQHSSKLKEIRLRPTIEEHDYTVKLNQAKEFLSKKHKVKLCLKFRGREIVYLDAGKKLLERFISELADFGAPESDPKTLGKMVLVTLGPVSKSVHKKTSETQS